MHLLHVLRCSPVLFALLIVMTGFASPTQAEVATVNEQGFEIVQSREVSAPVEVAYRAFFEVASWWDPAHTYSGKAENLSLDKHVGGMFKESLPDGGGVEHMHVAYVQPGKMIGLRGGLGPLAADGLAGSMNIHFASAEQDGRSTIKMRYSVGGFRTGGFEELAPIVDMVLGIQMDRLAKHVEQAVANATEVDEAPIPETPENSARQESAFKPVTEHIFTRGDASIPKVGEIKVEAFDFVVGRWVGPGLGGVCEEIWSPPMGGELQGMFRYLSNDEVKFRELFALREDEIGWVLRLKHFGDTMEAWEEKDQFVDFRLLEVNENLARFDGLTMHRLDDQTLVVYVAMKQKDGSVSEVEFRYQKVVDEATSPSSK